MSFTGIHYARLIAIPLPFAMAGYSFSFSQGSVPTLLDQPPQHSTPAFARVFANGAVIALPTSLIASIAQSYLAWAIPQQRNMWITAAVATISIIPFTRLVMIPSGISRLVEISKDEKLQEKSAANLEHRQLLSKWVVQNYVRSILLLVGGVAAITAGGI